MDKDFTKRIITDALLISAFVAFCYAIHVASQAGKFISFGIRDYASLISLDFPSVLVTIAGTVLYTILALVIIFLSVRKTSALFEKYDAFFASVFSFFINLLMLFIYTTPLGVAVISTAYDTHQGLIISSILYLVTLAVGAVLFTVQSYKLSRSGKEDEKKTLPKFLTWLKKEKGLSKTKILTAGLVACFMTLLPLYGYYNGYLGPRSSYHHEYSQIEGKSYVIVDRSSSNIILAEVRDDRVMQNYLFIDRLEQGKMSTEILNKPLSFGEIDTPLLLKVAPWL